MLLTIAKSLNTYQPQRCDSLHILHIEEFAFSGDSAWPHVSSVQTRPPSAQVLTVHNSPRQLSRPYTPQQVQATCVQPVVQSEPLALSVHAGLDSLAHVCFAADT